MQAFRNYLLTLLVTSVLVSACVLQRYHAAYPGTVGPELDDSISTQYRDAIASQQPEIVVLGDSMVQENVDAKALASRLGRTVYSIGYPGSSSAVWYLIVRHEIVEAPVKPRTLVILFRDTMLTQPSHRISPFDDKAVDVFASMDDSLVLERAFLNQINSLGKLMEAYVPFYASQGAIQAEVSQALRYGSARWIMDCSRKCVDDAVLTVLGRSRMSAETVQQEVVSVESPLYSARALNFDARLDESFLPEIVRLCRENNIELIFVRSRKQYYAGMPGEPRGLQAYLGGLQEYLDANGVAYLDMNGDPRLVPAIYTDPIHVSAQGRQVFTQVLTDLLAPLLSASQ
jgi:hypothetical protein